MEDGNITSWIDAQVGEFGCLQALNLYYYGTSDSDRKDALIDGIQLQRCQIPNGLLIEGFVPVRLYLALSVRCGATCFSVASVFKLLSPPPLYNCHYLCLPSVVYIS